MIEYDVAMDKPLAGDLPGWLVHPELVPEGFDRLRYGCGHYKRPKVNPRAPISPSVAELLNRGTQILAELDRIHTNLHEATEQALSPDPQHWKSVKSEMASYASAYAELIQLSKRLNYLINTESRELLPKTTPLDTGVNGLVDSAGQVVDA